MAPDKRSRTGCRQCHAAHYKCDETVPACQRCRTKGLACHYSLRIRWGSIKTSEPSRKSSRAPTCNTRTRRTTNQPQYRGPSTPASPSTSSSSASSPQQQPEPSIEAFEALPSDDDDEQTALQGHAPQLFQRSGDMDAYTYYVDTLAGQFQAHDNLHNPYRKLSVLALSSPVLLHTILSCAVEHMHISGRLPIQKAIQQQERAIRLIRAGLSGWNSSKGTSAEAGSRPRSGLLSSDQALLAAILLQPAVLAFSGSNLAHAQTHLDMASLIFSKVGYLESPDVIASSFIEKLLVQRFAIIDISLSIFDRRRPRIPAEHWFGQQTHSSVMDGSQPTFYEMTGCDHTTYTFLLRAAHLSADREENGLCDKVFENAIALETDVRLHLRASSDDVSDDTPFKSHKFKPLSVQALSRAFSGAALLLILRRVFGESPSSPRVKNAVSMIRSAVDAISTCALVQDDSDSQPAIDSAMALPFYLAARDADDPDSQRWALEKHNSWRQTYPNPARTQMMELAERIWEERSKGSDNIEARCTEVERSYKLWIL